MLVALSPPKPCAVGGRSFSSHPTERGVPFFPDRIEPRERNVCRLYLFHQRERPERKQRRPPSQRLADLLEEKNLRGAEEEKTMILLLVCQQLDCIQQARLLLHFVEDHQARPMIEPPHRIGRQAQPLVGIVKGEICERRV